MARKKSTGLTDAELRLMEVLWRIGTATVSEVAEKLPKDVELAYSTVLTTLRILETKGYLRHVKDGRAFVYEPVVGRDQARESAVTHLLRRFFNLPANRTPARNAPRKSNQESHAGGPGHGVPPTSAL